MQWQDLTQTSAGSHELDATTTWLCPLNNYSLLVAEGEKSISFLQGQCTCDMTLMQNASEAFGTSVMGAHCNHKGRMHSTFVGAKLADDRVLLRVHASISGHAQQNLQKYAALSRVKVQEDSQWQCFGVVGPQSESIFGTLVSQSSAHSLQPGQVLMLGESVLVLCHAANQFELWCRGSVDETLFADLLALPKQANGDLFHMLTMQRGIAELELPLVDKLLPQELNFQLTNGVSFSKGCYTGQEIVARMHYKAQLKKHMYLGSVSTNREKTEEIKPERISPGASLTKADGKTCGMVINSLALEATQSHMFLALCDDDALDDASLKIDENLSLKIQWEELPYAIS